MITSGGSTIIKRFLARQIGQIAGSLSLGVGTQAATVNDAGLQYEVVSIPVSTVNVDMANNRLVFKGSLPPGSMGTIYEMGLHSSVVSTVTPKVMNLFGGLVPWTVGTLDTTNARIRAQALKIDYTANGTTNAELTGLSEDLSLYKDVDFFVAGFYAGTNLSSIRFRIGTDASNYYEFAVTSPSAGYNIVRVARSTATKVGAPSWSAISYVAVRPSATAAGSGSVWFDGIRFESNPLNNTELLVSRTVLSTPKVTDPAIPTEIEYSLGISIT